MVAALEKIPITIKSTQSNQTSLESGQRMTNVHTVNKKDIEKEDSQITGRRKKDKSSFQQDQTDVARVPY